MSAIIWVSTTTLSAFLRTPAQEEKELDSEKIPTREEAIDYALIMVGTQDRELMTKALEDCYGKHEIITY
jgi:hypothetical protein